MCVVKGNYAFIDGQNLHLSAKELGWKIDHHKCRVFLRDKYNINIAYYFIGYVKENEGLYSNLKEAGFVLIFKETAHDVHNNIKGNVDAELVLQAMIDIENYDQALIITSDGDFACLVKYLSGKDKLQKVLAASKGGCSKLLSKAAGVNIDYLDSLRGKLEYKK